jgi:hypothetical protein
MFVPGGVSFCDRKPQRYGIHWTGHASSPWSSVAQHVISARRRLVLPACFYYTIIDIKMPVVSKVRLGTGIKRGECTAEQIAYIKTGERKFNL